MNNNAWYVWPSSNVSVGIGPSGSFWPSQRDQGCLSLGVIASVQHFRRVYGLAMNNAFSPKRRNNTGTKSNQVKCSHVSVSRQRGGGKQTWWGDLSLNVCTVSARPRQPSDVLNNAPQNEQWYPVILSKRTRDDVWATYSRGQSKSTKPNIGRTKIIRAKRTSDSDSATSKTSEKQHLKFFPREMGIRQIFGRFQPKLWPIYELFWGILWD